MLSYLIGLLHQEENIVMGEHLYISKIFAQDFLPFRLMGPVCSMYRSSLRMCSLLPSIDDMDASHSKEAGNEVFHVEGLVRFL